MAKGDGEWWVYEEIAATDRAEKREAVVADRARVRDPRWWAGGIVSALVVGAGYEAIGAQLGDGAFTPSAAVRVALVAFASVAVATVVSALRRL